MTPASPTRPIEDALTARIAELEQENARLREENNKLQEWYDEMTNSDGKANERTARCDISCRRTGHAQQAEGKMSDKYVYCANCKTVFVMDADSHINECPACDVPNSTLEIPECVASELAALKSENVNLSKKVTDYEKELRQSYKYDKTCSTCRYLDENRDCVLGIRCVNYTLWQGKIL